MRHIRYATLLAAVCLATSAALAQTDGALTQQALTQADATEEQVIAWRRHLHEHPELSYQERETADYIAAALSDMPGFQVQTGIAQTGIKAVLKGGKPGPVVALRADMDALPVAEQNDLPFKSTAKAQWRGNEVSVSHVCGHDAHMAMMLGAARVFSDLRDELPGTVVLLFQPAEEWGPGQEPPSGANVMMAEHVLDDPRVDVIMGQHIWPGFPLGIGYAEGAMMASGDGFSISYKGRGGHGASPWTADSPVVAAAETVLALNNVVAQRTDPQDGTIVLTVGLLQSGNRLNILPEQALIQGTIRSLSRKNQATAHELVRKYAHNIADSHGLEATVDLMTGYEVLINDPAVTQLVAPALDLAAQPNGAQLMKPSMASEDYGAFGKNIPSVFWFLNASPYADKLGAPNHSPEFTIDERAMRLGTRALVASTLQYMQHAPD